ncbi:MAG: hypothetical protein ACD_9C00313G0009 [uncultured bacterium]|nr:MAG: hypothetical protein ACD_9C00313G0009 [uncultured bacterium]
MYISDIVEKIIRVNKGRFDETFSHFLPDEILSKFINKPTRRCDFLKTVQEIDNLRIEKEFEFATELGVIRYYSIGHCHNDYISKLTKSNKLNQNQALLRKQILFLKHLRYYVDKIA